MSTEFNFLVIDANQPIEAQQTIVRDLVAAKVDLSKFKLAQTAAHCHETLRVAVPVETNPRHIVVPKAKPRQFYGQGVPGMDLSKLARQTHCGGRGRRLRAFHPDRPPGAMAGRLRPCHRASRPQALHPGQRRTGPGAKQGNILSRTTFSLFYATDFADQLENIILPGLRAGIDGPGRPLHLHPDGARHGARHGHGLAEEPLRHRPGAGRGFLSQRRCRRNWCSAISPRTSRWTIWESGMDLGLSRDMFDSFLQIPDRWSPPSSRNCRPPTASPSWTAIALRMKSTSNCATASKASCAGITPHSPWLNQPPKRNISSALTSAAPKSWPAFSTRNLDCLGRAKVSTKSERGAGGSHRAHRPLRAGRGG